MKKDIFLGIVSLLVIIVLIWLLFSTVSQEILLGLFVGLTPSIVLYYLHIRKEERDRHDWLLRNKNAYLTEIVDILVSSGYNKEGSEEKKTATLLKRFEHLRPALLVWGAPSVLHAWNELQQISHDTDSVESIIRKSERFFRVIRKELKHDDSKLAPGMVWATLLKPEEKQKSLDACKGEVYK